MQLRPDDDLVSVDPNAFVDVPLYWQQWNLRSALLDTIAAEVAVEARRDLAT